MDEEVGITTEVLERISSKISIGASQGGFNSIMLGKNGERIRVGQGREGCYLFYMRIPFLCRDAYFYSLLHKTGRYHNGIYLSVHAVHCTGYLLLRRHSRICALGC